MEVARRGGEAAMSHQALNRVHVGARFQQVGGKRVAQPMNAARLGDAGAILGGVEEALRALGQHRQLGIARARKQP